MANSISTSFRKITAMTPAATVTQNRTNGNQPDTIEKLSRFMGLMVGVADPGIPRDNP